MLIYIFRDGLAIVDKWPAFSFDFLRIESPFE